LEIIHAYMHYTWKAGEQPVQTHTDTAEGLLEWAHENSRSDRHIGDETIGDLRVSTVFLGMDHNWGEGEPILFETIIFKNEVSLFEERYCTETQARQGHQEAIERAKGHLERKTRTAKPLVSQDSSDKNIAKFKGYIGDCEHLIEHNRIRLKKSSDDEDKFVFNNNINLLKYIRATFQTQLDDLVRDLVAKD